ncbi:MAG: Gfo/Idh/MocA family oxidoreductase [Kiritimatiellia bacterium]|nr:Gfo/Idh/MocA family oxidoreductase [Kiritimatiellia bacterium]
MNNKSKVRLAVIGCGGLAQSQHIPNLFKLDNAVLHTLCDVRSDVLNQVGDQYGVARRETDHRKVLADPEVDGVLVVTREDQHVPLTLEALAAGKHVYVEKPLAETEEDCARVTAAQKTAGKIVAVGMNRRMAPAYRYARDLLWKHGGPRALSYRIADSYCLDWGKSKGYPAGARVVHEVCHIFDILRFFTKSDAVSVYCAASRDDEEMIVLRFASGAVATIFSSGYVQSDMPKEHFEATAEVGGLIVQDFCEIRQYSLDDDAPLRRTFTGHSHPLHDSITEPLLLELGAEGMQAVRRICLNAQKEWSRLTAEGNTDSAEYRRLKAFTERMPLRSYFMDKGWRPALEDFAEAIRTGREFAGASAHDGLQATRITQAVIRSRDTGEVVFLS